MARFSMKTFLDNWANALRNWRAAGTAIFLGFLLAWGWYMSKDYSRDKIVGVAHIRAQVVEMSGGTSPGNTSPSVGMVELEGGQKVRLMFANPKPEIGDSVPLRVEYFENGEVYYSLEAERRLLSG